MSDDFSWHKQSQAAYGEVGLREYFHMLDTIFSPTFNLQSDLRKRLQAVYPEVKVSTEPHFVPEGGKKKR